MHRTLIALGCALAFVGGNALAQQQQATSSSQEPSVTEKVKGAAKTVGHETKKAAVQVKDAAVQVGKDISAKAKEVKTATVGDGKDKQ
ncbi:hypothetical protein WG902_19730 [Ramlibacter sp. PS3R-8]|uniref:hypothetical protein n=1 Tax=Ramlibacter sp. PS3R-8 TaxID=3133437 RepID=UPI0030A535A8